MAEPKAPTLCIPRRSDGGSPNALSIGSELATLSQSFTRLYWEFNDRYFGARLPQYHVRAVFDLHTVANEPIYFGWCKQWFDSVRGAPHLSSATRRRRICKRC